MERSVSFRLNGKPVSLTTDDERPLLWVLRSDFGLTGSKFGCGEGICGACTVLVDEEPVRSCAAALKSVAGKSVVTIEGLGASGLHAVQQAFLDQHAFQCGYCTPGMILTAYAFLRRTAAPTTAQVVAAMDDNLCRCGAQPRIVTAVQMAARAAKGGRA